MSHTKRFPSSVYGAGDEPDPRFSLANERTFLAWIRTALAFIAGGLAVEVLPVSEALPMHLATSVLLLVAGLAAAWQAWVGWASTERALRQGIVLPSFLMKLPITVIVFLVALVVLVGVLT